MRNNTTRERGCRASLDRHWGWVVAVASFLLYFICCGTLGTFVLLFVYFEREFQSTAMAVGWIGSLGNGLLNLMSFVSSPLYERFTRRKVIAIGVLLCGGGILATSFTTSVWQVYITFGIVFAVGLNFTSNPSLNLMTLYFPGRNCVRATAFASAGQAVGALTMTPLLEAVLSVIGWRSVLQYISVAILVTCLPLAAVFKLPPQEPTKLHDHNLPSEANQKLEIVNLNQEEKCYGEKEKSSKPSNLEVSSEDEELGSEQNKMIYSNKANWEEETSTFLEIKETSEQQEEIIPPLPPNDKSRSEAGDKETTLNDYVAKNRTSSWGKYMALGKDHRHSCFFIGILGSTVSIYFNGINLVSCITAGGIIPESTAAWLITVFNVADLSSRVLLCFLGDHLPISRITVLMATAVVGAIASFLLTLGVSLTIFIVYCIRCVRGVLFGIAVSCVVELFGAHKTVETLTSLQIAYGIGGLLASSVAGLSYDVTGTYKTSHYTCSVLWVIASVMFGIVYKLK